MEVAAAISSSTRILRYGGRSLSSSPYQTGFHRRQTTRWMFPVAPNSITASANSHPDGKGGDGIHSRGRRTSPVDQFMPLLHARIREVEAAESLGHESERALPLGLPPQPPAGTARWPEWERSYCVTGGYQRDVFGVVGALHVLLMDTRPMVAIGSLALALFVLITSGMVVSASLAGALAHVAAALPRQ